MNTPTKSVKVQQVIIIVTTVGKGVEGDPIRPYRQIFDMKGNEIEAGDYTK